MKMLHLEFPSIFRLPSESGLLAAFRALDERGKSGVLALLKGIAPVKQPPIAIFHCTGGLQVCKTVTKELAYLCIGANAGPSKVEKARAQHVYIPDEAQLHLLIETGELVDIHA